MSSPKRHGFRISLLFILKLFSKPFVIEQCASQCVHVSLLTPNTFSITILYMWKMVELCWQGRCCYRQSLCPVVPALEEPIALRSQASGSKSSFWSSPWIVGLAERTQTGWPQSWTGSSRQQWRVGWHQCLLVWSTVRHTWVGPFPSRFQIWQWRLRPSRWHAYAPSRHPVY